MRTPQPATPNPQPEHQTPKRNDYKDTLNLPKTGFPMRGNLPANEPLILKEWEDGCVYKKIRAIRSGAPRYILHDGPPYANGKIHIGHVLNKTLKDIVIKFKTMRGFDAPYIPGWDCHGMPIEHQLFKEMKKTKHDVGQLEFRKKAYSFAMKFVEIQKKEFKRLGVFGDWDDPYLTLKPEYEKEIVASFNRLAKGGFIYRGLKPINWCRRCETALAEAEVEYETHLSPSIYVRFEIDCSSLKLLASRFTLHAPGSMLQATSFVVWTTTPWTLLSNVAIALHPELDYVVFRRDTGETFILAERLLGNIQEKIAFGGAIVKKMKGSQLEGIVARHPFLNRSSSVVMAEFVSDNEGTGCVHIAPGHGQEDYEVGMKYNLPVIMPLDEKGRFVEIKDYEIPDAIRGKNIFEANEIVIKILSDKKMLLVSDNKEHSYPHCWRCHEPLLFRATKQWFLSVDKNNLRSRTIREIKKVRWVPSIGERRISGMVATRPDWCLSRQRYWGVPIPILYCSSCNSEIIDEKVMERIEDVFGREGSDAWFLKEGVDFVPEDFVCPRCAGRKFRKETDILDVWFESGASHQGVLNMRDDLKFPADLYLEGSDQHRGWFQSSLLIAIGIIDRAPFKNVLTHGFVVDGEGKKMSKSSGNVISPQEVISQNGADVLRLWVSFSSYFDDIKISKEILQRTVEAYRKFRNTAKFLLGNIYDFDPKRHSVAIKDMVEIDRWAISRANSVLKEVTDGFERFMFHEVTGVLYKFCILDMSNFYFDILKDRLYTFASDSKDRRSAQTAIFKIIDILVRELSPLIPFTAEEIWRCLKQREASVHLSDWPEVDEGSIDPALEDNWFRLRQLREKVLKALEEKRGAKIIGSSLEAKIILYIKDEIEYNFLANYLNELPSIFIVSQVELKKAGAMSIEVTNAEGRKCSRCWNWSKFVGSDREHPVLCKRCLNVIKKGVGQV